MPNKVAKKEAFGPTLDRVNELLDYRPETGDLIQRRNRGGTARQGGLAGHINPDGYRRVRVDGKQYMAHRLVWLISYKVWPPGEIDHINGKKDDNRIENLRGVTRAENEWNKPANKCNSSGYRGVTWDPDYQQWRARVSIDGRNVHLGRFNTAEEANCAYVAGSSRLRLAHYSTEVRHG